MPLLDYFEDDESDGPRPAPAVAQAPPPIIPPPDSFGYSAYIPRSPVAAPKAWQPYGQYVTDRGQIENRIAFDPSKGVAPLSKLGLTPDEAQAGMEALVAPFLPEKDRKALMESPLDPGSLAKATAGFTQGAARTAEGLTSPINAALMVGTAGMSQIPLAARALSGAFTVDTARHVPELARELGEAVASKDPERITRAATELGATGAFTTTAGAHTAFPRPRGGVIEPPQRAYEAGELVQLKEPLTMPESVRELSKEPAPAAKAPEATPAPKVEEPVAEAPKVLLTPTVRIGEQSFKGKAHPLAIGEASKKLAADAPIEDLFKPESQGFTAIDPATGTERFVTRKEAAEIFEKQTGKKPTKPDSLTSEDLRDAGLLGHLDEAAAAAPGRSKTDA